MRTVPAMPCSQHSFLSDLCVFLQGGVVPPMQLHCLTLIPIVKKNCNEIQDSFQWGKKSDNFLGKPTEFL